MPNLFTYVMAFDSGFAPNPFGGICTLATCKPRIRKSAQIGDWIVGTGSNKKSVRRGKFLVYAMRVEEVLTFNEYWSDPRFAGKKPNLRGSYRMACGDNIYCPHPSGTGWLQSESYHSQRDRQKHIVHDTKVDRVLVGREFVYFGAEGPKIPKHLRKAGLVHAGQNHGRIPCPETITTFEVWFKSLGRTGYRGKPHDMIEEARKRQ
ncbi:MAG: hypothetical protein OXE84_14600 [Rhodobacteraceae bacterium]|nr:hypothetical protein [Paracoccaceae bacterium]MCY4328055.1 hypothetical protein [Paracoccaceae bacterium]